MQRDSCRFEARCQGLSRLDRRSSHTGSSAAVSKVSCWPTKDVQQLCSSWWPARIPSARCALAVPVGITVQQRPDHPLVRYLRYRCVRLEELDALPAQRDRDLYAVVLQHQLIWRWQEVVDNFNAAQRLAAVSACNFHVATCSMDMEVQPYESMVAIRDLRTCGRKRVSPL